MRFILSSAIVAALCLGSVAVCAEPPATGAAKIPLNVETVKARLVGYWRIHTSEADIHQRIEEEMKSGDKIYSMGKPVSKLSEAEKRELMDSLVRGELEKSKKEEQGGVFRFDADGAFYVVLENRQDAEKDQKQRITRGRWTLVREGRTTNLMVTVAERRAEKDTVISIDSETLLFQEQPRGDGPRAPAVTFIRVKAPPKWATDLKDAAPAPAAPKK